MLTAEIDEHHRHMIASAPRVGTLAQFDDQVAEAARRWKKSGRPAPRVWFRGQRDAALPLIPSALRKPFGSLDFRIQHGMFVEFRRRALGLTEHVPETVWGWLYLAQHHGFPTPLLDWSESSHVALFFALQRKPGATWKRDRDACVWVLNAGRLNEIGWGFSDVVTVRDGDASELLNPVTHGTVPEKDGKPMPLLGLIPEYVTERLRAQRGAFVAFAYEPEGLMRLIAENPDDLATPIIVPAAAVPFVEQQLDVAGVGESTVYPDLGGLAAEIARRHDRL